MSHILKYTEWESCGHWYCNDVEDLGNGSGYWWLPARMMNMTPANYLKWVIDNFHPDSFYYSDDCSFVGWYWTNQSNMRSFKNKINQIARKTNFII